MLEQLPETADFLKQAERSVGLEGDYPLAKLNRLATALCDTERVKYMPGWILVQLQDFVACKEQ